MHKLWVVVKNELKHYFVSPLAYVYLFSFLLLNASFALYFGDFFDRGEADLLPMFSFQPWLYLLFIPGIAMRLWAEEFRTNTAVQIITMPVSINTLVWGKFLASWTFCTFALLLTFPFWITVNILGSPDNGVILMGYFASFILAGCMLAISETMSSLTKNQVIALVLAVIANLFFFWSGLEYILATFRLFMPDTFIDVLASFSFISHFNTISQGLLELRDIIFFVSIIIFFNFTTLLIINFKTAGTSGWLKSNNRGYFVSAWILLLVAFFSLNILANNFTRKIQFDATEEKIFTLSSSTHYILKHLPEPVLAKLYFSPILEQRNPNLRQLFDKLRLLLKKYRDVSDGNFDFKIYNPEFLSQEEDIALANGVQPVPLIDINQNALFGLTLEDTLQNKAVIPFFTQNITDKLEQTISEKLYRMHHEKKKVGIISGLPIFGASSENENILGQKWQIIDLLSDAYDIVNIVSPSDFSYNFDVLFILFPQNLDATFIEPIKKFSKENGSILLVLDPANEASRLYSFKNGILGKSSLGELADFWNIKFYEDYVVADLKNSITVDATANYKTNPTFSQDVIQFRLPHTDMNPKHPITKELKELFMLSSSVIMPNMEAYKKGLIKFTPLLRASDVSSLMPASVVRDGLTPQQVLGYFSPDNNQKFIAAEVQGLDINNRFDLIVVGDSDFLYDSFWGNQHAFLDSAYTVNTFDNADFILNAIDYLLGDDTIIKLRGKRLLSRKFNDIEYKRKENSLRFKQQEQNIFDKIDFTKRALQEILAKKNFEERDNFTADELAGIAKVRNQLNEFLADLSKLRTQTFKNINHIDFMVTFFNLWLIPLISAIVLLAFLGVNLWKKRKNLHFIKFDKRFITLGGISLLLLVMALTSVWFTNKSSVDSYEGKLVFPNVDNNLNNINKIVFKSYDKSLTFVQSDGFWKLQEFPELPVYQERIRKFLTTTAQATFFEKKTNKAENLKYFNLDPIENKSSKAVQVDLLNDDTLVQRFFLGDINLDLGRGSRASFIKFDNQFQVWKINADYIDMDLDWHKWTYSNLWDLRFGRVYASVDTPENQTRLLMFMKYALNTPITKVVDIVKAKPLLSEKLNIENGNYLILDFYRIDGKSFVGYTFDKNNENNHLRLLAKYLNGKMVMIDNSDMEKIIEQLK